jgi:hypothetical protein
MLTWNGEWDRLPSSISTTRPATGTDLESQDMCLGMDQWTSLSCHTCTIQEQMLSTELSRDPIPTLLQLCIDRFSLDL